MNITRLRPPKSTETFTKPIGTSVAEPSKHRREASALLAEVLARLHGIERPVVQFMPACQAGSGAHIAHDFAIVTVLRLGRTLLLDGLPNRHAPGQFSPWRGSRKQRRSPSVAPDTVVSGLYHRVASDASIDIIANETPDTQPYRMIVVQSVTPTLCPSGLDRARQCHGSVLTVAAGLTRQSDLEATARQVRYAGGTLLGVVLFDSPNIRLC